METGGPETEINCQVSGAEWGACQLLCFLAGELGRVGNRKQLQALSQAVTPAFHLSSARGTPTHPGPEAGLNLEFGGLVNLGGLGVWV